MIGVRGDDGSTLDPLSVVTPSCEQSADLSVPPSTLPTDPLCEETELGNASPRHLYPAFSICAPSLSSRRVCPPSLPARPRFPANSRSLVAVGE